MAQAQPKLTEAEYLAIERQAETKSEFLDGEMFAMSGASYRHNVIVSNLLRDLGRSLRGSGCRVLPSDMRVRTPSTGLYAYPDVAAICGEPEFADDQFDTLTNPVVLFEVLSRSTANYDLGAKFIHYRSIQSVQEVLYIDQATAHVIQYVRQDGDRWQITETKNLESRIALPSLNVELDLSEVYEGVDLNDSGSSSLAGPIGVG